MSNRDKKPITYRFILRRYRHESQVTGRCDTNEIYSSRNVKPAGSKACITGSESIAGSQNSSDKATEGHAPEHTLLGQMDLCEKTMDYDLLYQPYSNANLSLN